MNRRKIVAIVSLTAGLLILSGVLCLQWNHALTNLHDLRVGLPESHLQASSELFDWVDSEPETGTRVYCARHADENGGGYTVRCRNGKVMSIQVTYKNTSAGREIACKTLEALLPAEHPRLKEHDGAELGSVAIESPTEFFYFGDDYKGEINYVRGNALRTAWVNAWIDPLRRDRDE